MLLGPGHKLHFTSCVSSKSSINTQALVSGRSFQAWLGLLLFSQNKIAWDSQDNMQPFRWKHSSSCTWFNFNVLLYSTSHLFCPIYFVWAFTAPADCTSSSSHWVTKNEGFVLSQNLNKKLHQFHYSVNNYFQIISIASGSFQSFTIAEEKPCCSKSHLSCPYSITHLCLTNQERGPKKAGILTQLFLCLHYTLPSLFSSLRLSISTIIEMEN